MHSSLDCIPCIIRQTLDACRMATDNPEIHGQMIHDVLCQICKTDLALPPPVLTQRIHRQLREITGIADPYRQEKERHNRMALHLLPGLREQMQASPDPLMTAVHLSIAGNIIDLGVKSDDFMPGARYKLGFKGVYADAEKNSNFSSELFSLCFLLGMDYDLPSKVNPLTIPVSFGGEISFSPEPLTWDDGEYYLDGKLNMNFHIMGNAAIILEYRYLKADFEENGYDWDKEDHNFLFGYRIRF